MGHVGEALIFTFVIGPLTLINPEQLDTLFAQRLIHSYYFFCASVGCLSLLVALNRMLMVYKPLLYSRAFTHSRTIAYTCICWICGLLFVIPNLISKFGRSLQVNPTQQ
ncbi:hypothetical protein L596_012555 [Steinernema carpocapsae]|uniref:7TM GPCR serpentine receptor class x (Srx) domain-containing protein n=1 Tax=Steinernema carpocapsae TaxID=34508 RepID=A0A4U5NXR9_STECR|nr:hypothetical protein L596_012555 [Steinernema carpocapsae]